MRGSAVFRVGVAPGGALAPSWVRDSVSRAARSTPSLDLRFADNKSLIDATSGQSLVTFTRASSGTYVGSDGLIKTATTNEARFDHNPTTGESLGLLVEEQRTNILLQSNQFDTTWTNLNSSETAAAGTAPDGTNTAWEFRDTVDASAVTHTLRQSNLTFTSGITYTTSIWAKAGTLPTINSIAISFPATAFGSTLVSRFNLETGVVSSAAAGSTNTIVAFPNGWYRCTMSLTATATATASLDIRTSTNTTTSYQGDGNGTILIWGAQIEAAAFPTSYIPTTTATVTRSADVASITGANFSSWYRQDEGTVFGDFTASPNTFTTYAALSNGTTSQNSTYIDNDSGNIRAVTFSSSAAVSVLGLGAIGSTNVFSKIASTYKANDFAAVRNAGTVQTDTSGAVPASVSQMNLGSNPNGLAVTYLNGTIRRLTYWPSRLPNSTLQEITR